MRPALALARFTGAAEKENYRILLSRSYYLHGPGNSSNQIALLHRIKLKISGTDTFTKTATLNAFSFPA